MKIRSGSEYSLAIASDAWALVPPDSGLNPWDYLPDIDTSKSYEAFKEYRDMGLSRSLDKVRRLLRKAAGYVSQLERWSRQHLWPARVQAFDSHIEKIKNETAIQNEVLSHKQELKLFRDRAKNLGWSALAIATEGYELTAELIINMKNLPAEKKAELKTPDIRNLAQASNSCGEQGLKLLQDALAVGQLLEQLETLEDNTIDVDISTVTN